MHRSGREGVFFSAGLGPFSQTARLQGLPLPRGGLDPCGVSTLFPAASRPPRAPRHFPNSRHYYSTQVTPVVSRRAGKKPGGASEDQMGQGRERGGGGGPPCKKFRETPRTPPPSPFRLMLCYAKSLQSCPTLCDPIDGSPPGSPIPGILQARTLEWGAIAFSGS